MTRLTEPTEQYKTLVDKLMLECGIAPSDQSQLLRVLCSSQWLASQLEHSEHWLDTSLLDTLQQPWQLADYKRWLDSSLDGVDSDAAVMKQLRLARRNAMFRLIYREVNGLVSIDESCREISYFAEAVLLWTAAWAQASLAQNFGVPMGKQSGQPQSLLVLAMGKLGARELNLSSDIDLIYVYPEAGETQGGRRSLANQEFFVRVGRKIVSVLDTVNADGFVFRVDMRLRPYGGSGALVANFDAMHIYYQQQGREWERYALIKARVVVGDPEQGEYLLRLLKPFVYRKYVDFGVIASLRELKQTINAEVKRQRIEDHIKLGQGGIREIEFIAQVFQLVHGGTISDLRRKSLFHVYPALAQHGYLPPEVVDELLAAYRFLRRVEHAIMMYADQQTHLLPSEDDAAARQALLTALQNSEAQPASWAAFMAELEAHRAVVRQHFQDVISEPEQNEIQTKAAVLWPLMHSTDELVAQASRLGFTEPVVLVQALENLAQLPRYKQLDMAVRARVNALLPLLLDEALAYSDNTALCLKILALIEAILRRSAYMMLLLENPAAREVLIKLMHASSWVSDEVIAYPALLDDLVQIESVSVEHHYQSIAKQLAVLTQRNDLGDLESQMDILRRFKRSHMLRVAACEILGRLPLMKVSDYLTALAKVILDHSLAVAYHDTCQKYGVMAGCTAATQACGFTIIGYGKLGGLELSHRSDLDMVFIFWPDKMAESDGKRSLTAQQYYARLAQRLIHILTTHTGAGCLYEVDMRLRPSGNSGAVVSSIAAYEKYQQESAWTWEHQALTRARVIGGDEKAAELFSDCRQQIIASRRDVAVLRQEVLDMRQKMRDNLLSMEQRGEQPKEFHIKHSLGGIVDIEFMVQFTVLAHASDYPVLAAFPDNIRTLETIAQTQLMPEQRVLQLIDAYKAYRAAVHTLSLQNKQPLVDPAHFAQARETVMSAWQYVFNE